MSLLLEKSLIASGCRLTTWKHTCTASLMAFVHKVYLRALLQRCRGCLLCSQDLGGITNTMGNVSTISIQQLVRPVGTSPSPLLLCRINREVCNHILRSSVSCHLGFPRREPRGTTDPLYCC
jgi:hypothetical protein